MFCVLSIVNKKFYSKKGMHKTSVINNGDLTLDFIFFSLTGQKIRH